MVQLEINGKNFNVASSWEEVNVRQYLDIAMKSEDKGFSEIEKFIEFVTILCDNKEIREELYSIDVDYFQTLKDEFKWVLLEPEVKDFTEKYFMIGDKKYSMKSNYGKLTVGESITIETLLKDKKIDMSPVEIAFCVLFREMNEDGSLKVFDADCLNLISKEHSEKIKITDVYKVICFFLNGAKKSSLKTLKDSSLATKKNSKVKTNIQFKIKKVK